MLREMIDETIHHALPAADRLTMQGRGLNTSFTDICSDFERVRSFLSELQGRVDRLTAVVSSEISTEDSRRGLNENRNLSRLTWLATTFVPLTFVASLFSMSDNVAEMKYTMGWYFVTAIPLTMLTLVGAGVLRAGSILEGWKRSS